MYCPNCGGKLTPGAKFCPNCGVKVSATESKAESAVIKGFVDQLNTREKRIFLSISLGLILLCLIGVGYRMHYSKLSNVMPGSVYKYVGHNSRGQRGTAYLAVDRNGNYNFWLTKKQAKTMSQSRFDKLLNNVDSGIGKSKYTIDDTKKTVTMKDWRLKNREPDATGQFHFTKVSKNELQGTEKGPLSWDVAGDDSYPTVYFKAIKIGTVK
ncbi:zinc-ribbon domain-containing protein [Limosilactobacillus sp.]|uniref:zinc ribbon domain-containing protein n=1 Tax=Limosilactobacillus sp. TaxID=2773925 RepID=UPI00345E8DC3